MPQAGIAEDVVRTGPHSDKRYRTAHWRNVRLRALNRDGWRCYVTSCMLVGNVADHIVPVTAWTTDAEFFDVNGLRASCRRHNTARGVAARLEREVAGQAEPVRRNPLVTPFVLNADSVEVQKALPLIARPHDHPGPIAGVSRHTTLYTGGQAFDVCPRDCPDRSRSLQG
jgi:hypothetical protein